MSWLTCMQHAADCHQCWHVAKAKPETLAEVVVNAIRTERFNVLPHPEVEEYVRRKGDNIDRWLQGMRRLRRKTLDALAKIRN